MSDAYKTIRELPFSAVAPALGIDLSTFKQRKDGEWYGRCPLHDAKTNKTSFSYAPDGKFHCFSCEAKGRGALDLCMQVLKIGFKDACEKLGSISPPTPETKPINDSTHSSEPLKPFTGTYHQHQVELPWLEARCPDKAVRELYGVFAYANPARKSKYQNKVFIPLKDLEGTVYGYLVRTPEPKEGESKYEFPSGFPKSRFLFGAAELKAGRFGAVPLKRVYLVESPLCCLHFASLGLPCVASYGWSISQQQIQLLSELARGIVWLPDADKRPDAAPHVSVLAEAVWVRFPPLPDGVDDPEQLGVEEIQALLR